MSDDVMCVSLDRNRLECIYNTVSALLTATPAHESFVLQLSHENMTITPKCEPIVIVLDNEPLPA